DPDKDARLRSRRQRDPRPAVRAPLARSRHGVRYRRHRTREQRQPGGGAQTRGAACHCRRDGAGQMNAAQMNAVDGLPPLRDVIRRHDLSARKSLGQNFLLDLNLTGRIARAAGPLAGVTAIEVGPGPGGLTRALLTEGAARVIAIERDDRAIGALAEIGEHYPDRLTVIADDAMGFDVRPLLDGSPARVVANLPYNIATALLVSWLTAEPWPPWYDRLVLMFQREVAERIVAGPGSKTYGRLSVL